MTNNLTEYSAYLIEWIREEVKKANCQGVILGLSGGIDSAVVALLAQKSFPNNHLTVVMPCHSQSIDKTYADLLVTTHNLKSQTIDLSPTYDLFCQNLVLNNHKLALANIKPRLRMTTLYALGQANNYLVLGTDNADEWHVGYFTKYGDGGVDLVPIIHLLKGEIKELAQILTVPSEIIFRAPTAGLWENQSDESELGFSYQQLDNYLKGLSVDKNVQAKIEQLHFISEHKRNLAKAPSKIFTQLGFKK